MDRPARARVRCPDCGRAFLSRVSGQHTRHATCSTRVYVPVCAVRTAVAMSCPCGRQWQTRAKSGSPVHCPGCGRSRWVPKNPPERVAEPAVSRMPRPQPSSTPTATPRRESRRAKPLAPSLVPTPQREPQRSKSSVLPPIPVRPITPNPQRTASRPMPTIPVPQFTPPVVNPWVVGSGAKAALERLGLPEPVESSPGMCAMFDSRTGIPCSLGGRYRVQFSGRFAFLPVCQSHRYSVESLATDRRILIVITEIR